MFGSQALETAIGLILMFTVVSLIATTIRETLEAFLQMRAINLERGVRELLDDPDGTAMTARLYGHALVSSLFRGRYNAASLTAATKDRWGRMPFRTNLPAYLPARNVALALVDLVGRDGGGAAGPLSIAGVRDGVDKLPPGQVRSALLVALDDAGDDLGRLRANLEQWFNSGMDRVSGWYRKQTQWLLFGIGLVLAAALNIDMLKVARTLYSEDARRALVVAAAQPLLADGGTAHPLAVLDQLPVPLGWAADTAFTPWALPGWIATALGVSLGAPFWFDLLNKVMIVRSTVKPHEKSPEEPSLDR